MAKYLNSFCRICGTPYHRCNCKSQGSWRKLTDTAEHYQIFCVIRDYTSEIIDATKAKSLLDGMDLSERETFRDNVKEILADIEAKAVKVEAPVKTVAKTSTKANATVGTKETDKTDKPVKKQSLSGKKAKKW